ncbi:MAG: ABC transporter ATP-binding protein [Selenomonadaceae bacterium]|nr:ABC transporter ATP-binding protein [Selenomonadaceae bacterium]
MRSESFFCFGSDKLDLTTENICVTIGGKEILRNVSYKFRSGKRTAIIGANGAGKSTFLKVLCLLNEKFTGIMSLDGKNLRELGRKNLSKVMAILPQEREAPQDTTVKQLVSFGRFPHRKFFGGSSSEDESAIKNALELTKLTDFENRQVISLSGGEKQRAWLAMTLAQRPKILLLDEPTTYLDIAHQIEVMDIITDVNKKFHTTIIMVLHDINHARLFSDEVLILKDKKLFATGNPKKILSAQTLSEVFNVEADIFTNSAGDEIIFPTKRRI